MCIRDRVKMGRTCLQDAVPITLGQEFSGYAAGIRRNRLLLERERARWCTGVLGATAVGTGMGCMPGFSEHIYKNLSAVCGREIRRDANLFDGLQASDSFIILHAHLQALATVAAKAALDIRLMGSGPRAGFCLLYTSYFILELDTIIYRVGVAPTLSLIHIFGEKKSVSTPSWIT